MSEGPRLVTVGTTNGGATAIQADVTTLGSAVPVLVRLTTNYAMAQPDGSLFVGFPFRPCFTGAAMPQYPHTVPSGTTLALLACEATALVAAGAAVLA
jgi:hypothetical protein